MIPSSLYVERTKIEGYLMSHFKEPLCELRIYKLMFVISTLGGPSKEPTQNWVHSTLGDQPIGWEERFV